MLSNADRQEANRVATSHLINTVRYDKRTTNMDAREQYYWMHYLQNDPLVGDYIRSQIRQNPQLRKEVLNQPVCGRCEKFAFYHKDGVMCPSCGSFTLKSKTHKVREHVKGGYYK